MSLYTIIIKQLFILVVTAAVLSFTMLSTMISSAPYANGGTRINLRILRFYYQNPNI